MENQYYYSVGTLKDIAACYSEEGIEFYSKHIYRYTDVDPWSVAEYRADFDRALNSIGKGIWTGNIANDFRVYKYYGNLQRVVIADIMGITDDELSKLGFYQIGQLRGRAYRWMANYLNGVPYGTQFITKG